MSKRLEAQNRLRDWRGNVAKFAYDNFKFEPDDWQKECFEVFPSQDLDKLRISLQACVGPGKTAVLAICGWNFMSCYCEPGEHPKGNAVSITKENLQANLWPEMAKWQQRSAFLSNSFEWNAERIFAKDHPETWELRARSFQKKANSEEIGRTLSGTHAKYVLNLIDESGDTPVPVLRSAEQSRGNAEWFKILMAGNPSSLDGALYAAYTTMRHLFHVIRITGDPDDPKRSPRVDIQWAREQIALYGRDNPWVMYSILGLFPPSSINTLLGPDEVQAAMERHLAADKYDWSQKRIGVDVARFGDDRTVLFPRQGLAAFAPVIMRNARSNEIAARVVSAKAKWSSELEFVDDTGGYGSGVIDSLIQAGFPPMAVNASGKAQDPRYYNTRAESWWRMAEWVKRGGALPPVSELVAELSVPTYTMKDGRLLIEPKDMVKKRLKRSPDLADALALTFTIADMPATVSIPGIPVGGKIEHEWDPYAQT